MKLEIEKRYKISIELDQYIHLAQRIEDKIVYVSYINNFNNVIGLHTHSGIGLHFFRAYSKRYVTGTIDRIIEDRHYYNIILKNDLFFEFLN